MKPRFCPLTGIPLWIHAFAWGGVFALVLLLVVISQRYHGRDVWSGWTESRELRRPAYEERIHSDDLFRTRANTWSNLACVLVGFYALAPGCHDLRRRSADKPGYLLRTPAMSLLFGVACCYLGFGSGLFHASLTRWGQQLDVAAMYSPLLVLIAINLGRWFSRLQTRGHQDGIPTWPFLAVVVLVASFLLYQYKWSMSSGVVLPTLILTIGFCALLDCFRTQSSLTLRWLVISSVALIASAGTAQGATPLPEAERLSAIAKRVEAGCRSVEEGLAQPDPQPSVRQLTSAALGWLELDQPAARAEKLVRHAFGLQDMDPASPGYGTVPWQQGHPEIKDPNAIEFTMQPVSVILLRHGARLSESFKQDAPPHVRGAIAAIRRHNVPVKYSNIYLMKLANLLLLGQAMGDSDAVAEGKALFKTWLAFTRTNGVTEYDSPTYSPIQADCLALAHYLTSDATLKARLKTVLDFYWADCAANYFAGRQTMTGPASRNYNQGFLFSDANIEYRYYLAGLRSKPPADTFLSDSVRAWTVARMNDYRPAAEILALADLPERVVKSKFGAGPGQDRYAWITPDVSLGSSSAYYGPQDRRICAELASERRLPLISFVVDALDAPFGLVRSTDRGGHSKPHHLPHLLATVQEQGFLLALIDLSPAIQSGEFTNLACNVLLPVRADQLVLNGNSVDATKPFQSFADADAVVGVREGQAAVAVRLFAADGAAGQIPAWKLEFDGNAPGAGRLAVHHYRGSALKLAEKSMRCGLIMLAARCETEAEFAAFLKRAAQVQLVEATQDGVWQVKAKSGAVELEVGLDLNQKRIALRRVNGRAWQTDMLSVNGRDWAAGTLSGRAWTK